MSLVNGETYGDVACANVHCIFKISCTGDIKGIDSHQVKGVTIGSKWGVANTRKGHEIAIFYKYLLFGKNASIHSPCQLEYYPNKVNSTSKNVNRGMQWIGNLDGYEIQLCVRSGLAHLHIHLYKDEELEMLPHAFLTDTGWDPFVERKNDDAWGAKQYDCNVTGFWSLVCPFQICAEMLGGEVSEDNILLGAPIIKSRHDSDGKSKHISTQQDSASHNKAKPSFVFNADEHVGHTFVMDQKNGEPVFAYLVKFIKEHRCNIYDNLVWLWLLFSIYDYHTEEAINYNKFGQRIKITQLYGSSDILSLAKDPSNQSKLRL
jgi:hypothetical protein